MWVPSFAYSNLGRTRVVYACFSLRWDSAKGCVNCNSVIRGKVLYTTRNDEKSPQIPQLTVISNFIESVVEQISGRRDKLVVRYYWMHYSNRGWYACAKTPGWNWTKIKVEKHRRVVSHVMNI